MLDDSTHHNIRYIMFIDYVLFTMAVNVTVVLLRHTEKLSAGRYMKKRVSFFVLNVG